MFRFCFVGKQTFGRENGKQTFGRENGKEKDCSENSKNDARGCG